MKLSPFSVQHLAPMVTGDTSGWPYQRGVDLVNFFNQFGARDVYGQGFPSREAFAKEKLLAINGKAALRAALEALLDPRRWLNQRPEFVGSPQQAVEQLNEVLKYDGYEVVKDGNFFKVRELAGSIVVVETPFTKGSELSELLIEEQIKKCRVKIEEGDYSGAITNARSLLEAVLLNIEKELDPTAGEWDGDLINLYNRVRKLLNLEASRKDISNALKQVLTGLSSIVHGLAEMRNKMSDSHATTYKPARHHAKLAVNAAKTVTDFLFETKAYQENRSKSSKP